MTLQLRVPPPQFDSTTTGFLMMKCGVSQHVQKSSRPDVTGGVFFSRHSWLSQKVSHPRQESSGKIIKLDLWEYWIAQFLGQAV